MKKYFFIFLALMSMQSTAMEKLREEEIEEKTPGQKLTTREELRQHGIFTQDEGGPIILYALLKCCCPGLFPDTPKNNSKKTN